jgi:site-specific DNA-cytosine methylase
MPEKRIRALELFCGIGGFAAAAAGTNIRVVCAVDQSPSALAVYGLNFPGHRAVEANLEDVTTGALASPMADFWWISPPCQPYTVRGPGRDIDDPRARSLLTLLDAFARMPEEEIPSHVALENVEGFARSEMRRRLVALLSDRGFQHRECILCPTDLGIPMRRPRYYLMASRDHLTAPALVHGPPSVLGEYLEGEHGQVDFGGLRVDERVLIKFGKGLRILDPEDPGSYTTCFTSGYGRSVMHSGSYLRFRDGVRRFSPREILRLLHFPDAFRFPEGMALRKQWHLAGNSLSVAAVRTVLDAFPPVRGVHTQVDEPDDLR